MELDDSGRTRTEIRVGSGTVIRDVFVEADVDGHLSVFAGRPEWGSSLDTRGERCRSDAIPPNGATFRRDRGS
ncbi:hypothetical protein [Salinigranum sp. GCM10025319]|uniref:hypothetical protein n=1 Tax=Salinigranum sp. GCM10025319 TaxID=3252687 RepID=UPI003615EE35